MNENTKASTKEKTKKHGGGCTDITCCPPKEPVTRATDKIGRNDPCYCGSNRKFKKCCGR
ncbi:MAG: SEC-C metal-binding domain-containing protein [Gammaproteobacteria bacterium]|jgi:uncharacterized protein YecA (UPF0149 family)